MPLRILFLGLPLAAVLLERDGHDVCLAGICRGDAIGTRRLRRRLGGENVLVKPDLYDPVTLSFFQECRPDLLVSWFWTKRIPTELVRSARLGGVGVHPSLLPRHRGPDPTYWAILSGDDETGVTAHRIEKEYDTGDILGQERLRIDPTWNAWQLARALDRPSLRLLRQVVHCFATEGALAAMPQDESLATQAPAPDEEASEIRWNRTTNEILRQIRALSPAPGAFTELHGKLLLVLSARPARSVPRVLHPGEACVESGAVIVRTGDSAIELLEVEVDGIPMNTAGLAGQMGEPTKDCSK